MIELLQNLHFGPISLFSLQIMLVKHIVNHINRINHSAANLWVISTVYNQKVCFTFIIDMYLPFFYFVVVVTTVREL